MNILSYIHVHRLPNPSGVGRVIDRLLTSHSHYYPDSRHRMLVEKKLYDAHYLDLSDYWKSASFIPHAHSTSWQQAQWVWLKWPKAEYYWNDVDVVYCPAESFVPSKKAKLVCTIHDVAGFEPDLYQNDKNKKWHCMKWTLLFKQMARHADSVVTVSEFSASRIAEFFPELRGKLTVIYNAPHEVFGSDLSPALQDEVKALSGGGPFVLVPGGLSLRKNAELILSAIPELEHKIPGIRLIIAGSCSREYRERLKALNCANVILAGYVSDQLLNALYQNALVVWFPSRYEGFGMPVIEAMAAGAPVVASSSASIPEVVGDAALLCDMDKPLEHLDAIHSLTESSAQRSELANAGLKQSLRYTWRSSAEDLEKLFTSL